MKNNNKGFSLVELIVVIAIMAILAAVAVASFSMFIPKTQQANDKQLVSDIEYALNLAYHNGDLTEGESGFIMLFPDDECFFDENSDMALVMSNMFGSDWSKVAKLQYDGWGVKSQMLSYADASAVVNSNFVTKYSSNELMKEVQAITNAVNGLSIELGDTQITLYDMFGYEDANGQTQNVIEDVIAEYGISKSWNEMNSQEKSNLMVLATASSINNSKETGVSTVIPKYALYTAYAAENADFNAAYQTFQTTIANIDPDSADSQVDQIKAAYNTLTTAAQNTGFNDWERTNGAENQAAFEAIMNGVGNAMKDNGDAILSDLGNANMFTTGVGNELYNNYLDSVYITASGNAEDMNELIPALQGGEYPGAVLLQYAVINGELIVDNSLPVD